MADWREKFEAVEHTHGSRGDAVMAERFADALNALGDAYLDEAPPSYHEMASPAQELFEEAMAYALRPLREIPDMPADVAKFHRAMDIPIPERPEAPTGERALLRMRLVAEEYRELMRALARRDLVGIADGICDLIYVAAGTAIEAGVDIRPIWREVHESNMRKLGGPRRADGKILKGPDWQPPDVAGLLREQGWVGDDPS